MTNQENMVLMLLKSLGVNYPVLKDWGYVLERLLVLQVTDNNRNIVRETLKNFRTVLISPDMRKNELWKILEDTNSEYVFFNYTRGGRGRHILEFLIDAVSSGRNRAIPIVLTSAPLPEEITSEVVLISLTELAKAVDIPLKDVVPREDKLPVVKDVVEQCKKGYEDATQLIFRAAVAFLYPAFKMKSDLIGFELLFNFADQLCEMSENRHRIDGIKEWFIAEFLEKVDSLKMPMYDLAERFEGITDNAVYYDAQYIYISNILFHVISKKLLNIYDSETIKYGLAETRVLMPEYRNTFTYKMSFRDLNGEYRRVGMLRFLREEMKEFGGLGVVEKHEIKGGNNNGC